MNPMHTVMAARAVELCGDGKWHNYEQVMAELMRVAALPGPAIRMAERSRKGTRHHTKDGATWEPPAERVKQRSRDELIAIGARTKVRDFLNNKGVWELDPPRRKPGDPRRLYAPKRRIRMIRQPRYAKVHPDRLRADRFELLSEQQAEVIDRLCKFLADHGYGDQAEQLRKGPLG